MVKYESRFAAARKVLKKQFRVNTKVVFDDDGMVRCFHAHLPMSVICHLCRLVAAVKQ